MPQTKTRIVCTQLQISSWFFRNRKPEFKDALKERILPANPS